MQLKILSKAQVQGMIDREIRLTETRTSKTIERLRKKVLDLEVNKQNKKSWKENIMLNELKGGNKKWKKY